VTGLQSGDFGKRVDMRLKIREISWVYAKASAMSPVIIPTAHFRRRGFSGSLKIRAPK
jgi:hypothetical protein